MPGEGDLVTGGDLYVAVFDSSLPLEASQEPVTRRGRFLGRQLLTHDTTTVAAITAAPLRWSCSMGKNIPLFIFIEMFPYVWEYLKEWRVDYQVWLVVYQ
ncbi:hypothetical protein Hdeb2414_s0008g00286551 [Helianthus debilis subsp. tardiflorus]